MPLDPLTVTLVITLGALVLFLTEALPVEVTAVLIAVSLMATGVLTPSEGLAGLSNEATVTVLAMFILAHGLERTGLVDDLAHRVLALARGDPRAALVVILLLAGLLSSVLNNTPIVALLIPLVVTVALRLRVSPSRFLMPLAFAAILGGTLTLVGTSANLVASSLSRDLGHGALTLTSLTPVGLLAFAAGVLFLAVLGPRLVPERRTLGSLVDRFGLEEYLFEVVVTPGSPLVGRQVGRSDLRYGFNAEVLRVFRDGEPVDRDVVDVHLEPGDVLLVRSSREEIPRLLESESLELDPVRDLDVPTGGEGPRLFEATVTHGPHVAGETLRGSAFRQRFGATVVAARRGQELYRRRLPDLRIRHGDTLLVLGDERAREAMSRSREFVLAEPVELEGRRRAKLPTALAIFLGVLLVANVGLLPLTVSALVGVVLMVLLGVLRPYEMQEAVDWRVVIVLAGVLPLGLALRTSGAASLLASGFASLEPLLPSLGLLAVVYLTTVLLAQVVSNVASVALMVPVAAETAVATGLNPVAFIVATALAASTGFMTPIGHAVNLMVYGPGEYRFSDFARAGVPLALVVGVVTVVAVPVFFPL